MIIEEKVPPKPQKTQLSPEKIRRWKMKTTSWKSRRSSEGRWGNRKSYPKNRRAIDACFFICLSCIFSEYCIINLVIIK